MFDKKQTQQSKSCCVDYALSAEGQKTVLKSVIPLKLIKLNLYKLKRLLY
jgi:hypothetical protein